MRNFKTEGIIIKRRNYKDQDRILTVLTRGNGKISVRAAGVRKITSRRSAHIEPLNHSLLTLYQGSSYPVLTEAATIDSFTYLKGNLETMGIAYHLCELIDGLCPEGQENNQVFYLLKNTLKELEKAANKKAVASEFEINLLSMLGYWNKANYLTAEFDTQDFIENILERKLKSKKIFEKIT